ncbi:bis-aminopropyl spermidine synthase family protein [Streptomonospora wellingtoniae]|uniref:Bis-aminopropyl spermidine synthase family protein n=1 Tax=Streptomonospora wellingtoniae TaxID=3075544 RepID=A0ABU2KVW7_9ACTN|nr:bis-aminopropyl spermidine synthase family protein [Streptomonospora sp. DSM 45055]MDT0303402.1 bis-aminopropyl spermidine synthase family protein [Streptomonospora sp. DSM 45055]
MHDDTAAAPSGRPEPHPSPAPFPARPEPPSGPHALLAARGGGAARVYRVPAALAEGGWWTPRELVRRTAAAHRTVEGVIDALADEVEWDADGARVRLVRPEDFAGYGRPETADPVAHLRSDHEAAAAELRRLVDGAPDPRTDLDHVAATADTALRRGLMLRARFPAAGTRLLCVGDHDLTALAAALVCPGLQAVVVDIDERMLAYIDGAAARLGLPVRCHFADLRLGLPDAVRGGADAVFTDPPYTPEGVELFVRRGVEGLADHRDGRVLLAYGASETTPALTAGTQGRLGGLGLVTEALWPDFNRYLGAEAIGAASDLYVLRPTGRTPQTARGTGARARVYSRGANAAEAAGALGEAEARAVVERVAAEAAVGEWPDGALDPVPAPGGGQPRAPRRVRLGTWLESPGEAGRAAVNLTGGWEDLLARVLLAAPGPQAAAVVPASHPQVRDRAGQQELAGLLEPRWSVRFLRGTPGPRLTTVHAVELPGGGDPAERLLLHCQRRAHGRLAATLREGLVRVAAEAGTPVNKRTARRAVPEAAPWLSGHTLLDLPAHRMPLLREAAAELAARAAAAAAGASSGNPRGDRRA